MERLPGKLTSNLSSAPQGVEKRGGQMALELTTLFHESSGTVQVFPSPRKAAEHIRDHLLTNPECEAWAVISNLTSIVSLDFHSRKAAAKQVETLEDPSQALYELYMKVMEEAVSDSHNAGWTVTEELRNLQVLLGFNGLLIVIEEGIIRTAFLPGQGISERTTAAKSQRSNPLPREIGMRSRGKKRRKSQRRGREGGKRRERREKWKDKEISENEQNMSFGTHEEEIFHRVFKPALDFVREQGSYAFDMYGYGLPGQKDYGLLNRNLPRTRMRYADWQQLRQTAGQDKRS